MINGFMKNIVYYFAVCIVLLSCHNRGVTNTPIIWGDIAIQRLSYSIASFHDWDDLISVQRLIVD
jgi:hypothetical protein